MFDGANSTARVFMLTEPLWPIYAERVMPSLRRLADGSGGRDDLPSLIERMKAGHAQVWVIMDGDELLVVAASEIISYPKQRVFRITGLVGRRPRRWMHLLTNVERVARDVFMCQRMECLHQPGHERLLRTGGWGVWHYISQKELT